MRDRRQRAEFLQGRLGIAFPLHLASSPPFPHASAFPGIPPLTESPAGPIRWRITPEPRRSTPSEVDRMPTREGRPPYRLPVRLTRSIDLVLTGRKGFKVEIWLFVGEMLRGVGTAVGRVANPEISLFRQY